MNEFFPPGSDAAIDAGCTCPIMDNAHGRGYRGIPGMWVFNAGCPVHGQEFDAPAEGGTEPPPPQDQR